MTKHMSNFKKLYDKYKKLDTQCSNILVLKALINLQDAKRARGR